MRSQKRPSRSGLSVRQLIVSGFVTSPDDQSRIFLLDANPIRIASNSLMSITCVLRLFPLSQSVVVGSVVELDIGEVDVQLRVGLDTVERFVGRDGDVAALVGCSGAFLGLLGR